MEVDFACLVHFDRVNLTRVSYNEFTWMKFSPLMSKFFPFFGCLLTVGISIHGGLVFLFSKFPSFSVPQVCIIVLRFWVSLLTPIHLESLKICGFGFG